MESSPEHLLIFKFDGVPNYACHVRLDNSTSTFARVTTLYYIVDMISEKVGVNQMENKEIQLHFDDENITTYEEIL